MTAATATALHHEITHSFARRRTRALALPALILVYLVYVTFAFDLPGLASRARLDNAAILLADFWSYKTHVTQDNRTGGLTVAIEGESKGTYRPDQIPGWVQRSGGETAIDLGRGYGVVYSGGTATMTVPGYGTIAVTTGTRALTLVAPEPLPDWISASPTRVQVTTPQGRFAATRSKFETFRYQAGWELFFFDLDSEFHGKPPAELVALVLWQPRIDEARPNAAAMMQDIWTNKMWRHGDVVWAIFETILMAFLGTMGAAMLAFPLAFFAASNFAPARALRFALRRVFDFIRGVDGLIWTIILSRAFGPGPLTGALAILLTDTGTFGKTFSEALENIDEKQVEGIRSTGANALQQARFGVIPQIVPVILSQVLYYLESNTRSATVIGAIVGGGIGLLLTQAIITQKDWEEVCYYMVLIVLMVIFMDSVSGWLRRKLIRGE